MKQLQHTSFGVKTPAKTLICALAVLFSRPFFSLKKVIIKTAKFNFGLEIPAHLPYLRSFNQKINLHYFNGYRWTRSRGYITGDLKMNEKSFNPCLLNMEEFNPLKRAGDINVMYSYLLGNIHENNQSKFKGEKKLII